MEKIIFECETITPMFLGGADGKPELRPPTIKAAMRFWWRALNADKPLKKLKEEEAKIFGGSGKDEGRSVVVIKILKKNLTFLNKLLPKHEVDAIHKSSTKISILNYLTFGPCTYEKGKGYYFNRDYIQTGSSFEVLISFKEQLISKETIILLIELISYTGGLGTKSRNGFGRFNLKIKNENYISSFENLLEQIKERKNQQSNYTSFSKDLKIYSLNDNSFSTWDKCLGKLGEIYLRGRESLDIKHNYDNRQYIAAPIIVGKGPSSLKSLIERHAKSYFLTVIKADSNYLGYIFFLPYNYCSDHPELNNILKNYKLNQAQLKSNFDSATAKLNTYLISKMGVVI